MPTYVVTGLTGSFVVSKKFVEAPWSFGEGIHGLFDLPIASPVQDGGEDLLSTNVKNQSRERDHLSRPPRW